MNCLANWRFLGSKISSQIFQSWYFAAKFLLSNTQFPNSVIGAACTFFLYEPPEWSSRLRVWFPSDLLITRPRGLKRLNNFKKFIPSQIWKSSKVGGSSVANHEHIKRVFFHHSGQTKGSRNCSRLFSIWVVLRVCSAYRTTCKRRGWVHKRFHFKTFGRRSIWRWFASWLEFTLSSTVMTYVKVRFKELEDLISWIFFDAEIPARTLD